MKILYLKVSLLIGLLLVTVLTACGVSGDKVPDEAVEALKNHIQRHGDESYDEVNFHSVQKADNPTSWGRRSEEVWCVNVATPVVVHSDRFGEDVASNFMLSREGALWDVDDHVWGAISSRIFLKVGCTNWKNTGDPYLDEH